MDLTTQKFRQNNCALLCVILSQKELNLVSGEWVLNNQKYDIDLKNIETKYTNQKDIYISLFLFCIYF